jgi:hypothetical protein
MNGDEKQEMRDSKGRFMKGNKGYNYRNPKTGRYIKKTQPIEYEQPQYAHQIEYQYNPATEQREKVMYRAVVSLNNVPIHSNAKQGRPRYKHFTWAKTDYLENISIPKMKEAMLKEIAQKLHISVNEFWFDVDESASWDIQNPFQTRSNYPEEGMEFAEY